MSKQALSSSFVYDRSWSDVGQQNTNHSTVLSISRLIVDVLKSDGRAPLTYRGYDVTDQNEKTGWEASGDLTLLGESSFRVSIDGRITELPVLEARFIGRRKDVLNGWDYRDDLSIDFKILDGNAPWILSQKYSYFKDIQEESSLYAKWSSSVVRMFSVEGLKAQLEGLLKNESVVLDGIKFDFNSAEIKPSSKPFISAIIQVLDNNPDWNVQLEGHTDFIGDPVENTDLSERRSKSVRKALVLGGIETGRVQIIGHGEKLANQNATPEQRSWDRRVDVKRTNNRPPNDRYL